MAIDIMQTLDVIESMENFLIKRRPPVELRNQVAIGYKIENQSVIIYEIRPRWNNPKEQMESGIAKTAYVKASKHWNIFWMQSDSKWHTYQPNLFVKTIKEFVDIVEEDEHHCFWG